MVFSLEPPLVVPAAVMMIIIIIKELETEKRHHAQPITTMMVIVIPIIVVVAGATVSVPTLVTAEPAIAFATVPAVNFLNEAFIHYGCGCIPGR